MKIAYVRVSSADQNEERQRKGLEPYGIDRWYVEKLSGKDTNRPQLQQMLDFVREGDVIHVHDFSRLARSTKDLLAIVEKLKAKSVRLISDKEKIDTDTPQGELMLTMIGAIAQFERQNLLDRQREGIEIAKQRGVYRGRKKITVEDFGRYYDRYMRREITKVGIARELNISRQTVDRLIREYQGD